MSSQFDIERYRDERTGKLNAYAWPGGYPIVYYDKAGEPFCAECADEYLSDPDRDEREKPVWGDVYYEGPPEECVCGKQLESAYGDPDDRK